MSSNQHAGVEPRNRFLPPRCPVTQLRRPAPSAWKAVPPCPALTDRWGERLIDRATVRLAYDDTALHVDAQVREPAPTVKTALMPGAPAFWTQDHLEVRFLRDSTRDLDQVQVIIAANGRVWDNQGLWQQPGAITATARRVSGGWAVRVSLSFAALGLAVPRAGALWRGIVAHTRWADGHADIACSSATELGFQQAERFGEWQFVEAGPPVVLDAVLAPEGGGTAVRLVNRQRRSCRGWLRVTRERGDCVDAEVVPVVLASGASLVPVSLAPEPVVFTRYRFHWVAEGLAHELGAVALRAPLPALSVSRGPLHPYLAFDDRDLPALRARLRQAPYAALAARVEVTGADLAGVDLPDPDDAVLPLVTPRCMNWFRVAKETMLRDGEGGLKPAARRIWELQSVEAREAWRGIVAAVTPTESQMTLLVDELNALLARRDFHDATAFAAVALPEEGRRLLARGVGVLRDDEVFRLNRMILQESVECLHAYRMDLAQKPGQLWARWLVTGDKRLIATATRAVQGALRLTLFGHEVHLHEGMAAGSLALAYDAFHPHLSRADRLAWQQLLRRLLHLYLDTARRDAWTVTTIANANPVGNGGCGLAALALWREQPALAAECLAHARRNIRLWLEYCQGADGGNTEGAQYWQYGMENFIRFAVALERVTGSDDGLLSHPAVRNSMAMVKVGLCNDGALHGTNDTVPMPIGAPVAWFLAGREADGFALWYGDHAARWSLARAAAGKPVVYWPGIADMLLYRPAVPEATVQPPLPRAFAVRSIEYGILRSDTRYDCRWTAGLKGSRPPYTHHNQQDTGALFVDLRGERLIIDPGYYKPMPSDHALPLIGGKGPCPPAGWTGAIVACEERGDVRYLALDSTGAYQGAAERVVRHLVLVGDEGLVLLDDIAAPGPVVAQYPCGGEPVLDPGGRACTVGGTRARLRLEWVSGPAAALACEPERSLHDTHWGYHFAECRMLPVTVSYEADAGNPLVTVFADATGRAPGPSRASRAGDCLDIVLPSARRIRFVRAGGRWTLESDHV